MKRTSPVRIGFLGAGKMATALAKGFATQGIVAPQQVLASDPIAAARQAFAQAVGAKTTADNLAVTRFSSVLVLAVKPAQTHEVLLQIREACGRGHLLISIAAGIALSRLEGALPPGMRVIRAMPNTPALVGAGAIAFARGQCATPADAALAQRLFSTVGLSLEVKENLLDAVTGLSGSGPAYGYLMIEAMSDGGVAAGLPREVATQLAAQTLLGASEMVRKTGLHPGALKDMVTSPGGTTIEGLHQLENAGVRAALINAVRAASERARQLGLASP